MQPRAELWEQQAHNRRDTVLLIIGFIVLLVVVGLGVDAFLWGGFEQRAGVTRFVPIAALFALLVGGLQSIGGYFYGAQAVLGSSHARPADPSDPREATLIHVVEEMRLASGLPMPRVFVLPDPDPNAFAVGRDPQHAAVAVTQGLLEQLNREELQGVIGHEMAHVRNLDIRTMTLVAALAGAVVLLSDFAVRMMRFGGFRGGRRGSRSGGGGSGGGSPVMLIFLVIWIVLVILTPLLTRLMAFAVSRRREFDADATSVEFTRNPMGLAHALRKIDAAVAPTTSIGRGSAHLCIADPEGRQVNRREGRVASLFATHPPIERRIAILEAMAGAGSGASPAPAPGAALPS